MWENQDCRWGAVTDGKWGLRVKSLVIENKYNREVALVWGAWLTEADLSFHQRRYCLVEIVKITCDILVLKMDKWVTDGLKLVSNVRRHQYF